VIGPGDGYRSAGCRIKPTLELARWHHPREERRDDDTTEKEHERVGEAVLDLRTSPDGR
jgi:hypothetical protein